MVLFWKFSYCKCFNLHFFVVMIPSIHHQTQVHLIPKSTFPQWTCVGRLELLNVDKDGKKELTHSGLPSQGEKFGVCHWERGCETFILSRFTCLWSECPGHCMSVKGSVLSLVFNLEGRICHSPWPLRIRIGKASAQILQVPSSTWVSCDPGSGVLPVDVCGTLQWSLSARART